MNNPEHIIVEEFGTLIESVKSALGLSVLNYQYGYITELDETLKEYSRAGGTYPSQKYPLVWLSQPFTVERSNGDYYGLVDLRVFLIHGTEKTKKAKDRMTSVFKPILYPIYREILRQIPISGVFTSRPGENLMVAHSVTDRYYWGEEQQRQLNDVVDCMEINNLKLLVYNNFNS